MFLAPNWDQGPGAGTRDQPGTRSQGPGPARNCPQIRVNSLIIQLDFVKRSHMDPTSAKFDAKYDLSSVYFYGSLVWEYEIKEIICKD